MNLRVGFRFLAAFILGAFAIAVSAATTPTFEIGTWGNFCQGALTHTFDDNGQSGTSHQTTTGEDAFNAKGFHMTIFVITGGGSNPNWASLKTAFSKGHEIASHSVTHTGTMPTSELAPSQETIKKNVPGEMCATIAYPNCNTPGDAQVLKYYIAGRNCTGSLNPKSPSNWAQINSPMIGTSAGSCSCLAKATDWNSKADQAASGNSWVVFCNHGIDNDGHGWANTSISEMKTHLDYLDKNRSKVWVETFGNVARYIHERDAAKVAVKSSTSSSYTITVTDNLADSIFNFPLSIRTEMPSNWTTVAVKQGTKAMDDTIVTVSSKKYVMFQAVPNAGDVVISSGVDRVLNHSFGFDFNGNIPAKRLHSSLIVDPSRFEGSNLSVTLFNLQGKELARYSLQGSQEHVLQIDKIKSAAFIVKVAGGGKTYVGTFLPQL